MNAITAIKIEKGIPLPASTRHGSGILYPWAELEVGDSFSVPDDAGFVNGSKFSKVQSTLISCARTYAKRHNPTAKFTVRVIKNEGVVRVWRVA